MKNILIVFSLLFATLFVNATDKKFEKEMSYALTVEDTASSFASVYKSAKLMEALTEKYDSEWLNLYWAAHIFSQCAVFARDQRYGPFLDTAQTYYDKAWAAWQKHGGNSPVEESEFYVLQSNIHGLRIGYYAYRQDNENMAKYRQLDADFLAKAGKTNPENPRVYMRKGINLLRSEETIPEGKKVLAEAIKKYENYELLSDIHPNWGRNWIDFWLQRVEGNN